MLKIWPPQTLDASLPADNDSRAGADDWAAFPCGRVTGIMCGFHSNPRIPIEAIAPAKSHQQELTMAETGYLGNLTAVQEEALQKLRIVAAEEVAKLSMTHEEEWVRKKCLCNQTHTAYLQSLIGLHEIGS